MRTISTLYLCIFACCIIPNSYAGEISEEARYIYENEVSISRIDSFFFQSSDYGKFLVAESLLKYKDEEAITLFKKLLNNSLREYQGFSIFPLINAGEFELGFNKFKEMILNNDIIIHNLNFRYKHSNYSKQKFSIFEKHKDHFIPFFKDICFQDSISYEIKFWIADLLYYLGEEREIVLICNEIITKTSESRINNKEHSNEESINSNLRGYAKRRLQLLKKKF